ncbi:MAG: hypothetical protein QOF14_2753 [Hyphomicrobiales bacterium]|jgi:hypothetical protein|nr:hypothetical protein [Hyphomicrobiales bacterium]
METKVIKRLESDQTTEDDGKVRMGDFAPAFDTKASSRPPTAQTKVARDAATEDGGKVRLGDFGPVF